jgi:hypothetical protein
MEETPRPFGLKLTEAMVERLFSEAINPPPPPWPAPAIVRDFRIMIPLCGVVRTEADREQLLEFLEGLAKLDPPKIDSLLYVRKYTSNLGYDLFSFTPAQFELAEAVSRIPHRQRFGCLLEPICMCVGSAVPTPTSAISGMFGEGRPTAAAAKDAVRAILQFADFVRRWRIPPNAHKFCGSFGNDGKLCVGSDKAMEWSEWLGMGTIQLRLLKHALLEPYMPLPNLADFLATY